MKQRIMVDAGIKQLFNSVGRCGAVGQSPHHFCNDGFQRHIIGFQQAKVLLNASAHLVHGHIAAFLGHLRGHHDGFPALEALHLAVKLLHQGLGNAAHAKAFNHKAVIMLKEIGQKLGLCARNKLAHAHLRIKL